MAIWIDVTTSLNWNRPPVGIVRTELECARRALSATFPQITQLCYFDRGIGEFRKLSNRQTKKILDLISGLYEDKTSASATEPFVVSPKPQTTGRSRLWAGLRGHIRYSLDPVESGLVRGWATKVGSPKERVEITIEQDQNIIAKTTASQFREDLAQAGIGDGNSAFSIPIAELITAADPEKTQRLDLFASGNFRKQSLGSITFDKQAFRFALAASSEAGPIVTFSRDDVYLSAGLDWDNKDFNRIYDLKSKFGFKFVGFCYDLIPFFFPHLCVGDVSSFFSKYFTELSWCADGIVCISESSRKDYKNFVKYSGCPIPETKVVRLGSSIKRNGAEIVSDASPVNGLIGTKYILFVSTIERRKNHEVLYKAYVRLVERGVQDLPKLVFVGMRGWGVSDLFNDLVLDPRVKDLIVTMNNINDDELSILYENCLFTVFPSLYEGWGLPVAESLGHNKYCLASGAGSIPEIAGDLLDYLDPWDVQGWADAIQALLKQEGYLESKERAIRKRFRVDQWSVCVDGIFEFAQQSVICRDKVTA
ncbi:glycosyltransferase family 1 protein [Sinorhizobium sp. NFACC03]|uniref:glycosyltransferase family 4 protein n=1 Tax=Sinorhizobium sp. NFACC03 TaxID=1566295 RepID=UPI0008912284|nr:glycosyltransferase family 1 protein [Sinorhizobium sp. NFACC03]SDA99453.1 Glycosyl transferases group 1 [Sinorhizobium sp. NFACC03]